MSREHIDLRDEWLTRSQFAIVVGANESWLKNTARSFSFGYTPEEARRLAAAYRLQRELRISLERSIELADEVVRFSIRKRRAVIAWDESRCTAIAIDLARFHATYATSLSVALDVGGMLKRGRHLKQLSRSGSRIVRASERGVNIGDLIVGVTSRNHHALRTQTDSLLKTLSERRIRFVIVGGVAAMMRGAVQRHYKRAADEVDICYEKSRSNVVQLAKILASWRAYPRWIGRGYPFMMDERQFRETPHMVLTTTQGCIDLSDEIHGIGDYQSCRARSSYIEAFKTRFRVIEIDALIDSRKASRRRKDLDQIPELEALLAVRDK